MYDAIIIGARCAGSPTAMLLARKGYRVLLVDKSRFPSDIMSTHLIWQAGVARLERWGLLEKVKATNCPPVKQFALDVGEFILVGSPTPAGEIKWAYAPRRKVIDKILVDAAAEAGAEVREGFAVRELITDGNRVTGIRGPRKGGAVVTENARIVIGADGMRSVVARTVRAPEYNTKPALGCGYYTYWSGLPVDGSELYLRPYRTMIAFPTNDGLVCLVVAIPNQEFHQFRSNVQQNYLKALELVPRLAERVRAARREEPFVGTADLPNFFRKPYGPGWALVGDAGYHKDPITAQGISDAFRDVELLAAAIDDGFSGRVPLDTALAGYEQRRNMAALPIYESTCQRAPSNPLSPEMMALFSALRGNQAGIDRLLGTDAGTVPVLEFFAPENIARIMQAAPAH